MTTATRSHYSRRIERPLDDYSLSLLVDELRVEARAAWRVMHQFRKQAQDSSSELDRCDYRRMELTVKHDLVRLLSILNAGRDRRGSYDLACSRRLERDIAAYKAEKLAVMA